MFVVTLPASAEKNPLAFARRAKRAGADVLEIRTDLTPRVRKFQSPLPILVAVRSRRGGLLLWQKLYRQQQRPSAGAALKVWKVGFLDIDCADVSHLRHRDATSRLRNTKRIVSHHDFKSTPSLVHLKKFVERMLKSKPWAIKIVTQIVTEKDLVVLMELQVWLRKKKIRSIVLGMGDKAHLTRVLSPLRNALTYAFLDGFASSAEGQLPLSFYIPLPRPGTLRQCSGQAAALEHRGRTALFGIIGGPQIAKSLSPQIYNALFKKYKIDAVFTMFPTDDFHRTLRELEPLKIAGLCVTAPFKREAYAIASQRDALVAGLGVCNTLVRTLTPNPSPKGRGETSTPNPSPKGRGETSTPSPSPQSRGGVQRWSGFNTDVAGIVHGYPFLSRCNSVAILGAGGVVPSVIEAVRQLNPKAMITVFARDTEKAKKFLAATQHVASLRIADLRDAESYSADVVICAINQDISLPLPQASSHKLVDNRAIAIDLRYNTVTTFMKKAKQKGFHVYDGRAMLIHQALRQFEYFTGVTRN